MTGESLKVYVLEIGSYDGRYIAGIYATLEAAKAAHQPKRTFEIGPYAGQQHREHTYTWGDEGGLGWLFDADWDDFARITEHEVKS